MNFKSWKRVLDVTGAIVLLLLTSPLFLLIAAAIRLDSPGSVFYVQKRLGREGKLFNMVKFRSMAVGTPEVAADLLINPEIHTTKVGRLLRHWSLDELPQLLNILTGTMSFIGPRPSLYNQWELNKRRIRLGITSVRPGLSGYAQINGRNAIADDQKLEYDLYYVKNMSFGLDIYIVYVTLAQILLKKNF